MRFTALTTIAPPTAVQPYPSTPSGGAPFVGWCLQSPVSQWNTSTQDINRLFSWLSCTFGIPSTHPAHMYTLLPTRIVRCSERGAGSYLLFAVQRVSNSCYLNLDWVRPRLSNDSRRGVAIYQEVRSHTACRVNDRYIICDSGTTETEKRLWSDLCDRE